MKRKLLVLIIVVAFGGTFLGNFTLARATPTLNTPGFLKLPQAVGEPIQIVVDTTGWTQTERNYLQAAAVSLLFQNNITYDDIWVKEDTIYILNPLEKQPKITPILTTTNLKTFIVAELEKIRIATEAAQLEASAKQLALEQSKFKDMKLAAIDAEIDAIKDIEQLKAYLKEFVRYIIANQ